MPDTHVNDDQHLQQAVEQFLLRRMKGDPVTVSQFAAEYSQLGTSLIDRLRQAELIATAKDLSIDQRSALDNRGSSRGQLSIRCPHCQTLIEIDADMVWSDVRCDSCSGSFSLIQRSTEHDAAPLSHLAHFELLQRVGIGAFGTVWRARDAKLDRIVALKIPRKGQLSEKEAAVFLREAQSAAQIVHPHVVHIYEVGRHEETLFIASEFIDGSTLAEMVSENRPTAPASASLLARIARGLDCAHKAGVIHRDLKPGNILIDAEGEPHVTDFGLAKFASSDVTMTIDGALVGTPAYMAPEQAAGTAHSADSRSDVYALGVILFQLLTGDLPFRGTTTTMLKQVVHDPAPSPRKLNQSIARDLETICLKCLEKKPANRFASAKALSDELDRFLRHEPIHTRPVGVVGRLTRWARRRPTAAALAVALLASFILGTAISLAFAFSAREKSKQLATNVERLKQSAYAYDMTEVQRLVDARNIEPALRMLERYEPESDESHRCGPEWHYLWRTIHSRQTAVHQTDRKLRGLAIHPSGSKLVWGNEDGAVFEANLDLTDVRPLPYMHTSLVQRLIFSHDGRHLYSLAEDGNLVVFDFDRHRVVQRLQHPAKYARALGISADGRQIALGGGIAGEPSLILIWTLDQWDSPQRIDGPKGELWSIHWSDSSDQLLVGGHSNRYIIDLSEPQEIRAAAKVGQAGALGQTSRWLKNGTLVGLYRGPSAESVLLIGPDDQVLKTLDSDFEDGYVSELEIDPDERLLATPTAFRNVHIYDLKSAERLFTLSAHRGCVTSVEFCGDGHTLASTSDDGSVRIWDLRPVAENACSEKQLECRYDKSVGQPMSLAPNGDSVALWSEDGISLFNVTTLQEEHKFELPPGTTPCQPLLSQIQVGHDATHLAATYRAEGETVYRAVLWTRSDSLPQAIPLIDDRCVSAFCFTPNGQQVLAGVYRPGAVAFPGEPSAIALFSCDTLDRLDTWQPPDDDDIWRPHRMFIAQMCFSQDGTRVYSVGGRDRMLKVWRYSDGALQFTFRRPNNLFGARCVAVSPDNELIAVGWLDDQITLVDSQGALVTTLLGHQGPVSSLSFTADGRTLVSSSHDGTIKIWDALIGQLRTTLTGHRSPIVSAAITPNGERILSLDADGKLRSWNCTAN